MKQIASAGVAALILVSPSQNAWADGSTEKFKFPPIDFTDKNRCVLQTSNMGQANAQRDKLYDLRECKLSGANAQGFDLSGVIMGKTDVSKANFVEAYFSKGFLRGKLSVTYTCCDLDVIHLRLSSHLP